MSRSRLATSAIANTPESDDDIIGAPLTGTRSLRGLDRFRSPQPPASPRPLRRLPPASEAIYDWNTAGAVSARPQRPIELCDETLRDGIQSPSVTDPSIDDKIALMHMMDGLGSPRSPPAFPRPASAPTPTHWLCATKPRAPASSIN